MCLLARARCLQAFPTHDAVVSLHQGVRLSYREFHAAVEEVARGLLSLGVQKEDRVGIWAPNCAEWAVLQFATAKIGAILVNINPAYRASELAYALGQAGVSVLVLAPGLRGGRGFVEMAESVRKQTPQLRLRLLLAEEGLPEGGLVWRAVCEAGRAPALAAALAERQAQLQPEDPINIQYTSGTTGFPKAATLSHRNILNNGLFIARTCLYTQHDRVCIPVPLYHCFGMVIGNAACVASGAAAIYPAESFSPEAALAAVQAEGCTSLYGVPTMFIAELALPTWVVVVVCCAYRLDSLRTGVMAGSPCPVEVMKKVRTEMHMGDVTIAYGMTETSPVSFQSSVEDPVDRRVSTVGRIHPHLEARVVDPGTCKTLPHGSVGELQVRGYSVMLGYWGDAASTAQAIDQEGWMRTGDLATIDAQGYCNIVGRIKDMILRGGENIYPREVEEFQHTHPAVADVQVFGVPSRLYGEQVCAWVKLRDGFSHVGRAELREFCRGKIARYKVPRYWKMVDSFPMTVSGKPQKYLMREQAVQDLALPPARR
ncbi:hypothetical protein CHLNCDRAFT_21648 [Chlorella variabilis]|uniref:AMP-dependent synthetase/ligase domain-containing protein n=1 Tax=Chlorella variabilis TaxID=554065 RepID=E1ZA30_CHLVA|nr:hypothetical protein CHLNCDRAFT_21648 [Chlorella variabilis]EFN57192.1 hypothetical protein CHLNCDRAFT_21648 [Chlorella variabilis]|eukprot:XP_005849294.1 hypothetical protein CHLNCDRAFT_21648 [Chlorella variabilis]